MLTAVISLHYCGVNVGGEINTQKGRDIVCDLTNTMVSCYIHLIQTCVGMKCIFIISLNLLINTNYILTLYYCNKAN